MGRPVDIKIMLVCNGRSDGVLGFSNISTLKTRRNYYNIIFLYKLIHNIIQCPQILEKINYRNSRINNTFFIDNGETKYLLSSPTNTLMMAVNGI